MYRVQLGAFDFTKEEAATPRDAVWKLIDLLRALGKDDEWDRLVYEVDDLENDSVETFDLGEELEQDG